jgi:hypothetical protein
MLTLDQFLDSFLDTNPFVVNRVLQPSTADVDAESVHQAAFHQLVDLARLARRQQLGVGAVLWGEAGVGKSHLLSRLARWARHNHQACFIYFHNLQARSDSLPRYLLHCVLSHLTLGRTHRLDATPLFSLVNAAVKSALASQPAAAYTWVDVEDAFDRWLDHLVGADPSRAALIDRTVYQVLFHFYRSAYITHRTETEDGIASLAVHWLSGDVLDASAARRLNLRAERADDQGIGLRDEQHIKQVLIALAQTALYRNQPLLLCFDQVDNLEPDQIAALARFLQALLDSSPNLLVVTCGVQEGLLRFHEDKVIQDSAWDRLAQFEVALQRISPAEASQIVQARLDRFLQPFLSIDAVAARARTDRLFPLGASWFEAYLQGKPALRPRDVITWAREGWRREQEILRASGGPTWLAGRGDRRFETKPSIPLSGGQLIEVIDRKVEQKIEEHKNQRQGDPQGLPPDAANLVGLLHALLKQCLDPDNAEAILEVRHHPPRKSAPPPTYDLIIRQRSPRGREITTGMLVVATSNGSTAAGYLRRLLHDRQAPERVFLVTDERRRLPLGIKGQNLLEKLGCCGPAAFQAIEVAFAQYAELDALQAVVGMARSGDLEIEVEAAVPRRVTEQEVIASHHRRRRYARCPPLRELFGPDPVDAACSNVLVFDEQDGRQFILAQLAKASAATSHDLAAKYAAYLKNTRHTQVNVSHCQQQIVALARQMQRDGLVHTEPADGGLSLTLK